MPDSDGMDYTDLDVLDGGFGGPPTLTPEPSEGFVNSDRVRRVTERALAYLSLGYPVHMAGPAGTGKTTMAFHVAAQLGRPVSLIHGNDELGMGDLVGKDSGYTKSTVVDNYVSSVLKTNEDLTVKWSDNRLTEACEQGHTLIYDEFNRTTAEANNILLSILEEKVLNLPKAGGSYLRVHPEFRLILTSNPSEYAGVHRTQDALMDRLVTIDCGHYDPITEAQITAARSGIDEATAWSIVQLVSRIRERTPGGHRPTVRGCIVLGKVLHESGKTLTPGDTFVEDVAWDLLGHDLADAGADRSMLTQLMREAASSSAPSANPVVETPNEGAVDANEPPKRRIRQRAA